MSKCRVKSILRFCLEAAVGSSVGAWVATDGSGQAEAPKDAGSSAIPDAGGVARTFWIDPSIAAWRPVPWRKVHIEYHTSRHMPKLAQRFDPDEFGDRLLAATVNGATVFAKDMYAYCYFPSRHGRMHPNLSFDLLGAQVKALRKRNIWALAYFMLTWSPELAERHPEWLVVHRPGDKSRPRPEQVSAGQKAFTNTVRPDAPRRSKDAPGPLPPSEVLGGCRPRQRRGAWDRDGCGSPVG
jgi:hypothetical protein